MVAIHRNHGSMLSQAAPAPGAGADRLPSSEQMRCPVKIEPPPGHWSESDAALHDAIFSIGSDYTSVVAERVHQIIVKRVESRVEDLVGELWRRAEFMIKHAQDQQEKKIRDLEMEVARSRAEFEMVVGKRRVEFQRLEASQMELRSHMDCCASVLKAMVAPMSTQVTPPSAKVPLSPTLLSNTHFDSDSLTCASASTASSDSNDTVQDSAMEVPSPRTDRSSDFGSDTSERLATIPEIPDGEVLQFSFTLRRNDLDVSWGLDFKRSVEAVLISGIKPAGAIAAWNRQCADGPHGHKTLRPGDKIVKINGASDYAAMVKECKERLMLTITVNRLHSI